MIQRIVYFSRNSIIDQDLNFDHEVQQILRTSRRNNEIESVTGALLFNSGGFAQTLEGSPDNVERIFERIQRDPRHSDVLVLECKNVSERLFPNWSMGFIGASMQHQRLFGAVSETSGFNASILDSSDVLAAMQRLVREEELAA